MSDCVESFFMVIRPTSRTESRRRRVFGSGLADLLTGFSTSEEDMLFITLFIGSEPGAVEASDDFSIASF